MKSIAHAVVACTFLLSMSSVVHAEANDSGLVLNGKFTQGSLFRGQLPVGSKIMLDGETLKQNDQGKFVFGFARDAKLNHRLSWTLPDGSSGNRDITLKKRDYNIQRIDGLKPSMVTPPQETLDRINRDSANVGKARPGVSELDALFTGFVWPAEGPITGVYGSQRVLNGVPKTPHYGVDVGAPTGTLVVAPAAGVITLSDDLYYSGNTVILDHGMGVYSTFLHLDASDVKVGDVLKQGDPIGKIGATGRATGPHLDWRLNLGKMRLDPALLVPARH